ncbi:MAG: DUF4102 domain-containing protein [Mariprofundus sp.]|nr:DUF4102 domain-containing protein [Mariprofundus sp.]
MVAGFFITRLSIPSYTVQRNTDKLTVLMTVFFLRLKKYRHKEGDDMALSDVKAKAAKVPKGKKQMKSADSGGLYLLVKLSGKYWRLGHCCVPSMLLKVRLWFSAPCKSHPMFL